VTSRFMLALALAIGWTAVGLMAMDSTATLTDAERKTAVTQLNASRDTLTAAVAGLSEAQLTFRPGEGRWTIAEVLEHLAVTEMGVPQLVQQQLMKTPARETVDDRRDASIRKVMVDRSRKAQSPEPLRPTGRFPNGQIALQAFTGARGKTIEYTQATADDLRHHVFAHPALGPLDGYQWILFLAAHTERHTAQIEEVKASAGFPAK